ncbi:hypothetical protein [Jatrophihabitans fulvus]
MSDTGADPRDHPRDHRRPATTGALAGTAVWRALIAVSGFVGLFLTLDGRQLADALSELSQQASLAAGVIYTGLLVYPFVTGRRFHEPRSPWWRGAIGVVLVIVMVVYAVLLDDTDYSTLHSKLEHVITPALVVVDVLVVGRNLLNVRWWSALGWLAAPLAYLVYYNVFDIDAYDIALKVGDDGFLGTFVELLGGTVVVALLIVAVGRARAAREVPVSRAR